VFWHMISMGEGVMNKPADPRLVWVATVLAAAVFVLYVAQI